VKAVVRKNETHYGKLQGTTIETERLSYHSERPKSLEAISLEIGRAFRFNWQHEHLNVIARSEATKQSPSALAERFVTYHIIGLT
jgi:hypothetical protein